METDLRMEKISNRGMRAWKPPTRNFRLERPALRLEMGVSKNEVPQKLQPCHSFTRWANRFLINVLVRGDTGSLFDEPPVRYTQLNLKDINGTERPWCDGLDGLERRVIPAWYPQVGYFRFMQEIAVGDSDAPEDYNHYNLQSLKQWCDSYTRRSNITETDGTLYCELQGTVTAQSAFTAKEAGLFGMWQYELYNRTKFLVSRDLISPPIDLATGDVLVIVYRLTVG